MDRYVKAIVGALIAGLGALGAGVTESGISGAEWFAAGVATLAAFQGIYWVKNAEG